MTYGWEGVGCSTGHVQAVGEAKGSLKTSCQWSVASQAEGLRVAWDSSLPTGTFTEHFDHKLFVVNILLITLYGSIFYVGQRKI